MKNAVSKRNRATFFIAALGKCSKHKSVTILGHNIFNEKLNCVLDMYVTICGLISLNVLPVSLLSDNLERVVIPLKFCLNLLLNVHT